MLWASRSRIVDYTFDSDGWQEGAMKQLCDDLRQFAVEVRQVGFSLSGGVGERQCLDLSERMLASVKRAQARMAGAKSTLLVPVGGPDPRRC
jgi:hypothetical protein